MKKIYLWLSAVILTSGLILTSCSKDDSNTGPGPEDEIEEQLKKMTLREKVGQMFYMRPEALDTSIHWKVADDLIKISTQEVTDKMKALNAKYPVGGIILYAWNIKDEPQLARFVQQLKALNGSPLLCIDEEGGRISRIANNENFHVKKYESTAAIGATGDPANAYECGHTIGTYLKGYGFDIEFAPVADAMEMGAITQQYSCAEATVGSIVAGADIVLGPQNYVEAFEAVIAAIERGTFSEERINQSVRRILKLKMK